MRRWFAVALALAGGAGVVGAFFGAEALAGSADKAGALSKAPSVKTALLEKAATGELKQAKLQVHVTQNGTSTTVTKLLPAISGAAIVSEQDAICAGDVVPNCGDRATGADASPSGNVGLDSGTSPGTLGCGNRDSQGNVRVNQDCTYRRQAEESITYNPSDPNNLVAGQNDSRVGFNQCGIDFSTNNGSGWGDMLPPFRQHLNTPQFDTAGTNGTPNQNTLQGGPGTFHTYDAASDPVNATDSSGRSFFSCVLFDIADNASGIFVTESPVGARGSFYYNVPELRSTFLPVEDNSPYVFYDKEWIAADHYAQSPNRDNVYVTFTVFKYGPNCVNGSSTAPAYCESPIFGSMSTDHGHTWSTPEEISGSSPQCFQSNVLDPNAPANACNLDQGSNPVVLPNGQLEVVFNNGNTSSNNPNAQQLGVHCAPAGSSANGTAHFNCATPVKVGDDVSSGEPMCDFGRGPEQCVPGPYIRTNDFPRIVTENTQNNHIYTVWQDYRHGEYDIHMSQSSDGGLTWSDAEQVNADSGLDHYFPAVDQSPSQSDRLGVSYYRSERVPGENTTPAGGFAPCSSAAAANMGNSGSCQPGVGNGNSDYVLAGGTGNQTPYAFKVLSPVFPPPDGIQSGFNGDYSAITINKGAEAHPIWSDTRNVNPYPANGVRHDEDVFTDKVGLPSGNARPETGRIGSS